MSNLNLPHLSFDSLSRRLGNKTSGTLGYATTVHRLSTAITISHHGNTIAVLTPMSLGISNAGHSSATTRTRLNKILRDNGVPFGVGQKNWEQILFDRSDDTSQPFTGSAQFLRADNDSEWALV